MLVAESQANWLPASDTQTSSRLTPPTMRRGAEVVDVDLAAYDGQVQRLLEQRERRDGDGQADEEAPAPAESGGVDDEAADERAGDRGHREDGADVAGVAAALTRGDHAGDDDLDQRGQAADAEALDDAGADQHLHARARSRR